MKIPIREQIETITGKRVIDLADELGISPITLLDRARRKGVRGAVAMGKNRHNLNRGGHGSFQAIAEKHGVEIDKLMNCYYRNLHLGDKGAIEHAIKWTKQQDGR